MHYTRLLSTMMVSILVVSLFLVLESASAQDTTENIVNASFNIEMRSATDFKIYIDMSVIQAEAFDVTYSSSEIHALTTSTNQDDIEALGVIKSNLHNSLNNQIKNTFQGANVTPLKAKPVYTSGKFNEEYNVNLTSEFFNMAETINAHDFINGMLDVGAHVRYNLSLKADPGWDITYSFDLGEKLEYQLTDGKLKNNIIEWTVRNSDGKLSSLDAFLVVRNKNPTTIEEKEDISIEFILDSQKEPVSFESEIAIKSMSLKNYAFLPAVITNIEFVPSDSIRLFVKNNLVNWDEIYQKTIKNIQENIKNTVETSVFNQTLTLAFTWDNTTTDDCLNPFDIEKMDKNPAVKALLKDDDVRVILNDISSKAVFGLVNAGAKSNITPNSINFGKKLEKLGYNYNITLKMPQDIYINSENAYTWDNKNKSFSGLMLSTKSPEYKQPVINTIIEIEAETTDLNLLSFFTGDTELSFGLKIDEEKNYKVTKILEPFSLPETIDIIYLNSDAIRLCIEENVFNEEEINTFLTNEKTIFEQTINKIITGLDAKGNINNEIFQNSLQWDSDITKMDDLEPVKTQTYSHTSHPTKFKISLTPPGLKINNQTYKFTGLENQYVTYRIIFPNGIKVSLSNDYEKVYVNETADGKQYIELSFSPEEANTSLDVTITLEPSILFILALLTPCMISIIIAIILIIVIIVFRKKRRKRKTKTPKYSPEPEEDEEGYESEDYYIPPPPGSK